MEQIYKYPRTHHIRGSRLQPGDEDLNDIPFAQIKERYVVIEEKVDGANAAIEAIWYLFLKYKGFRKADLRSPATIRVQENEKS
ncbi:MAG: hypothetical protein MJK14_03770 [Rivularia sp. ALOHA_DT_140]|nr:hypothetical protein [Rivularia sp. ALOHA_DT_140]